MTKKYITGFSIMELIIVLLISSIISLVVLPNYEKVQTYAKENTSKNQLYNLQLAIETYFLTNNMYPNATTIIMSKFKPFKYSILSFKLLENKTFKPILSAYSCTGCFCIFFPLFAGLGACEKTTDTSCPDLIIAFKLGMEN